jgi:hypothetical protein
MFWTVWDSKPGSSNLFTMPFQLLLASYEYKNIAKHSAHVFVATILQSACMCRHASITCTQSDCGVCSWPWQWFADYPLWTVTDVFQLQIHWAGTQSRFVRVEVIQLFSVAFCVVRAVHKIGFRLVVNETLNKWRPVERRSGRDRESCLWQDLYVSPDLCRIKGHYPSCEYELHSLEQRKLHCCKNWENTHIKWQ